MGFADMLGLGSLEKRKKLLEQGTSEGLGSIKVKGNVDKKKTMAEANKKAANTPKVDANKSVAEAPKKWKRMSPEKMAEMEAKYGK